MSARLGSGYVGGADTGGHSGGSFVPGWVLNDDDPDNEIEPIALTKGDREDLDAICQRIRQ